MSQSSSIVLLKRGSQLHRQLRAPSGGWKSALAAHATAGLGRAVDRVCNACNVLWSACRLRFGSVACCPAAVGGGGSRRLFCDDCCALLECPRSVRSHPRSVRSHMCSCEAKGQCQVSRAEKRCSCRAQAAWHFPPQPTALLGQPPLDQTCLASSFCTKMVRSQQSSTTDASVCYLPCPQAGMQHPAAQHATPTGNTSRLLPPHSSWDHQHPPGAAAPPALPAPSLPPALHAPT